MTSEQNQQDDENQNALSHSNSANSSRTQVDATGRHRSQDDTEKGRDGKLVTWYGDDDPGMSHRQSIWQGDLQ
jgi:hypothetical protein